MEEYIKDEKSLRYLGRFDFTYDEGPKFAWSASSISAKFFGTKVSAKMRSYGSNYFLVIIDGKIAHNSLKLVEEKEEIYVLAENLKEGEHEVTLFKRNEFNIGSVQFMGFNFHGGRLLPKVSSKSLKIEIIGDSISCGYGNEAENENVPYDPKYDNSYYSYASIAARRLNADHMIIACSGFGLIRNYGGNMEDTMPKRYPLVVPGSSKRWDFNNWTPQVVVINLGTNDFSEGYIPDKNKFVEAYKKLLKEIHNNYKEAKIICSIGPAIDGEALRITREYVKDGVVQALREENNSWVYFLEYPHQLKENGYGVVMHPSIKTHEINGEILADFIKDILK